MSLTCGSGHYIGGASSCPRCGWIAPAAGMTGSYDRFGPLSDAGASPGLSPGKEPSPLSDDSESDDADTPVIDAPLGALRGVVVDGMVVPARAAGGVMPLRLLLLLAVMVTLLIKGPQVMAAIIEGTVRLTLLFIVPVIFIVVATAIIGRIIPVGGCLTGFLRMGMLGAVLRPWRQQPEPDGWDLQVLTPSGLVRARVAATLPLSGGEEIVIHGPTFNGTKHAWLAMVISPLTCTRLGRGVIPAILGSLIILPGCAVLLLNL